MLTRTRAIIQYASDLHLEFRGAVAWPTLLRPVAPILVLAGDLGNPQCQEYRNFLHWSSRNWAHVIVIAGNHELYNKKHASAWKHIAAELISTRDERLAACEEVSKAFTNVHFLQQKRVDINGIAFLGCTLWTDLSSPTDASTAIQGMNDYNYISIKEKQKATPADTTKWHQEDRAWLSTELSACNEMGTPAVVVTHHVPSRRLISPRFQHSPLNCCFAAADCEDLIQAPVRAWIYGHTHQAATQSLNNVQMVVNPAGYPGETTGYCREMVVDISASNWPVDERLVELISSSNADEVKSASSPESQTSEDSQQSLVWV